MTWHSRTARGSRTGLNGPVSRLKIDADPVSDELTINFAYKGQSRMWDHVLVTSLETHVAQIVSFAEKGLEEECRAFINLGDIRTAFVLTVKAAGKKLKRDVDEYHADLEAWSRRWESRQRAWKDIAKRGHVINNCVSCTSRRASLSRRLRLLILRKT